MARRFTREELERYRDATVPDLIGHDCRLLFVGINPGLWTAATQTHFCHPSNRFYPALRRSGLVNFEINTNTGMTSEQRSFFTDKGIGISNLVPRATVRASELSRDELVRGGKDLRARVALIGPTIVAVVGVTAYRTAFENRAARLGKQDIDDSAEWWVLPNPSGLNAHVTIDDLASWFGQVAHAAGVS